MRQVKIRNLLLVVVILLAAILVWVVSSNFQKPSIKEALKEMAPNIDVSLQAVNYAHTESGVKRWELEADQVERSTSDGITRVKGVKMAFFDESGTLSGGLVAMKGQISPEMDVVDVAGDVVLTHAEGYRLLADELSYLNKEELVVTEGPVRMESESMTITGVGMQADIGNRKVKILSKVFATFAKKALP